MPGLGVLGSGGCGAGPAPVNIQGNGVQKSSQLACGMHEEKEITSADRPEGCIFPELPWSLSMGYDFRLADEFQYDLMGLQLCLPKQ